jgi:hypothetical protein
MWHSAAMARSRWARAAGILLLVAAGLLPAIGLLGLGDLPDQDPTPEMLRKQAADQAVAEHRFAVTLVIGGVLALCGVLTLVYARWLRPADDKA